MHHNLMTHPFFDEATGSWTYVLIDLNTHHAAIIDPVLSFDPVSGNTCTELADKIIAFIHEKNAKVEWILETHIHADRLTAASYLKKHLGGKVCVGARIKEVLAHWIPIFETQQDTPLDGSQFDGLFEDEHVFQLGETPLKVIYTPGHTPACVSYLVENMLFVGDVLFMPDVGSGRTDFPGGSAQDMYSSIQKIYSLSDDILIMTGHDYPPRDRVPAHAATIAQQKEHNSVIPADLSREDYVKTRVARDSGKALPKLLLPSIQVNMRAGSLGNPSADGHQFIKIPLNVF